MAKWTINIDLRGKFSGEYEIEADTESAAEEQAIQKAIEDAEPCVSDAEWEIDTISTCCDEDELTDEDDIEDGTDA